MGEAVHEAGVHSKLLVKLCNTISEMPPITETFKRDECCASRYDSTYRNIITRYGRTSVLEIGVVENTTTLGHRGCLTEAENTHVTDYSSK